MARRKRVRMSHNHTRYVNNKAKKTRLANVKKTHGRGGYRF